VTFRSSLLVEGGCKWFMAAKSGGAASTVLLLFISVASVVRLLKRLRSEGLMDAEWECDC